MSSAPVRALPPPPTTTADGVLWRHFCSAMENVLAVSRTPKFLAGGLQMQRGIKLRYLFEGASWLRPAVGRGESVFPYLRLVLADKDAKRGRFNMKEKRLAEMYTAGLAISGEHPDAKNLVDWKAPQAAKPAGGRKRGDGARANTAAATTENDFAMSVLYFLERHQGPISPSTPAWTLLQVNAWLDELVHAETDEGRQALFGTAIAQLPPPQHKWLMRVILRDMKLGLGAPSILAAYHPDAQEAYSTSDSLEEVCADVGLRDRSRRVRFSIACGRPFAPMLAARYTLSTEGWVKPEWQGDFFLQKKLDGERATLHWRKTGFDSSEVQRHANGRNSSELGGSGSQAGGRDRPLRFFSRASMRWSDREGVMEHFASIALAHCAEAVLDGEMLSWNAAEGCYNPFNVLDGSMAEMLRDPDAAGRDTHHLRYMVFDLLWVSGWPAHPELSGDLTAMALAERHALLHELLVLNDETRTYLEALPALRVDSGSRKEQADVVAREFEAAVECGDEGIMVKRASAPYAVDGKRGLDWLKIKPDYAEQGCEMIDCAIVGAFEGTGARLHRFRYSHFLLAVPGLERWKPEDGRNDDQGRPLPMTMVTFSKVGTGMSHEDLTVINKSIETTFATVARTRPVKLPSYFGTWVPTGDVVPDVVLRGPMLKDAIIIELKATELNPSNSFSSGLGTRFPRVERLKPDKPLNDCITLDRLLQLSLQNGGRLALPFRGVGAGGEEGGGGGGGGAGRRRRDGRKGPRASQPGSRRRIKAGGGAQLLDTYAHADVSGVEVEVCGIFDDGERDDEPPEVYVAAQDYAHLFDGVGAGGGGGDVAGAAAGGGSEGEGDITTRPPMPPAYRSRAALEGLVRQLGGRPVANRSISCQRVVAGTTEDVRIRQYIEAEDLDILHPCWLLECLALRGRAPLLPRHLLHSSRATREGMSTRVDVDTGDEHGRLLSSQAACAALLARAEQARLRAAAAAAAPATRRAGAGAGAGLAPVPDGGAAALLASAALELEEEDWRELTVHAHSFFRDAPPARRAAGGEERGAPQERSDLGEELEAGSSDAHEGAVATSGAGAGRGASAAARVKHRAAAPSLPPRKPAPSGCVAYFAVCGGAAASGSGGSGSSEDAGGGGGSGGGGGGSSKGGGAGAGTGAGGGSGSSGEEGWLALAEVQFRLYRGMSLPAPDARINVIIADERDGRSVDLARAAATQVSAAQAALPGGSSAASGGGGRLKRPRDTSSQPPPGLLAVVSFRWVTDSIAAGRQLPVDDFMLPRPGGSRV